MNTIPQELNWVKKRERCILDGVEELISGIDNDVAIINQLRNLNDSNNFTAVMLAAGTTLVVSQKDVFGPKMRVKIGIRGNEIVALEDGVSEPKNISATVGLNIEGRCILKIKDGPELEQWQFRKMALERLFFGDR